MVQVRRQPPASPAKKKRLRRRIRHDASTGEYTVIKVGESEFRVPAPEAAFLKIRKGIKENTVGRLLVRYIETAEKAARAGRDVDYTVRVTPDGEAEFVTKPDALDAALKAAKDRGQAKVAEILKGADMLTASDFGSKIGVSHETVNVKRRRGEVLGLQAATRTVRYPEWQLTDTGQLLPGLSGLFEKLGGQPWAVYRFLRTSHVELNGRTALEALKAGEEKAVLEIAAHQATGVFT